MADSIKILWIQDEFEGPVNGLADYNGESLWFKKVADKYELLQLTHEDLEAVISNHKEWCAVTGAPLQHGDPHRIKRTLANHPHQNKNKQELPKPKLEPMSTVHIHKHKIIPSAVTGTLITTINSSQFSNFNIPRQFIYA